MLAAGRNACWTQSLHALQYTASWACSPAWCFNLLPRIMVLLFCSPLVLRGLHPAGGGPAACGVGHSRAGAGLQVLPAQPDGIPPSVLLSN